MNRRQLLQGLGATAVLWPLRGLAESPVRTLRPTPDFGRLRAGSPFVVGVRPYRKGGVRLGPGAPIAGKPVVHNYGHAGAGITLAFGCAEEAADHVDRALTSLPPDRGSVAVIGTGVIGLTTALAVARRHPGLPVTLYAKDLDLAKTTSAIAGGQFEPSGVWRAQSDPEGRRRLEGWLRTSRDRILALTPEWERYGIAERDNFTLAGGAAGFDDGTPPDVVPPPDSVTLPFERLSIPGRRYRTWLLAPPRLLPALKADLLDRGTRFVQRGFTDPAELGGLPEGVVVNCTGYGARALFADDRLIGQRGHLVLLEKPSDAYDWLFGGGCANGVTCYVFCRQDDIVVGGTVIGGDDRDTVVPEDARVFERLLTNASSVFEGWPGACTAP